MIPYWPPPDFHIGRWHIPPFNLMLLIAVSLWVLIAMRRARREGIDPGIQWRMCFWAVVGTLIFAHLAKVMMESWPEFVADPTVVFRKPGIRSLGGLIGGLLAVAAYARFRKLSFEQGFHMLENITFALPLPWIFGRLGCFLVHDHPGAFSNHWLAVQFPEGPRFDLGLLEMLFLIPFSAWFFWLDRNPRPLGFFFGLYTLVYGAFRLCLDSLALEPYRYYGWVLIASLGIITLLWSRRSGSLPAKSAPA